MSRWFVGSSSSNRSGLPASARAERGSGQLAARERAELAVQHRVVAEAKAVERRQRTIPPGVAAGVLERGLSVGIAAESRLSVVAVCHPLLQLRQLTLERHQLWSAREDVVTEGDVAVAWRALVVQRDLRPLRQHELAAVDRRLAEEHPQQGRLPGAVATGERHPVTALELEGDATQQRLAGDVLAQIGGDDDGHQLGW